MNVDVTRFAKFAIRPYGILFCSIFLSFAAWVFPGFGFIRKGFVERDSLLSMGALNLFLLYAAMIFFALLCYHFGARIIPKNKAITKALSLHRSLPYYILSGFALLGCGYFFYYLIGVVGFSGIVGFISEGQANEIKKALYEDYSIGPLSLRYIIVLAGGIAMFRILSGISRSVLDFSNIAALLLTGLASSRLSVVIAGILSAGLFVSHKKTIRLPIWQLIVGACAIFALLSLYNTTRNSNFYEKRGNSGFLDSGLSEMITYLGAPFQGSLSTAGNLEGISRGRSASDLAGIETSLTTNSALSELTTSVGYWSLPLLVGTVIFCAFFMGLLSPFRDSYLALPYFVFLYGFAEFWRIYMFNKGIFITLLFFSLAVPLTVALFPKRGHSRIDKRTGLFEKKNQEA